MADSDDRLVFHGVLPLPAPTAAELAAGRDVTRFMETVSGFEVPPARRPLTGDRVVLLVDGVEYEGLVTDPGSVDAGGRAHFIVSFVQPIEPT